MSKNTMYLATYHAHTELTETFDMIWPIDGALWRFKNDIKNYLSKHRDVSEVDIKAVFFKKKYIHGINFRRTAYELEWDKQEQYIAKLLLVNITAIFDSWVDSIIDAGLTATLSRKRKKNICDEIKSGNTTSLTVEIFKSTASMYSQCFVRSNRLTNQLLTTLFICYKYFKSCRNCCAHGDTKFSQQAERDYIPYSLLSNNDLDLSEKPSAVPTFEGQPFRISLRGVVGFTHVINKIMLHYDCVLSDNTCIEQEIVNRWVSFNTLPVQFSERHNKRNAAIRSCFIDFNMGPIYVKKTNTIYDFLKSKSLVI